MKKYLLFFIIPLVLLSCGDNTPSIKENLLTAKIHIEDSIVYSIPEVPRLCDAMSIEKKYVNIGDCKLYCEIEGEGMPLVLVHGGLGGTHHCFHPWLSGAAENFKLIYYDQRACGLSDFNPGKGYSFDQAVDDLENLRKELKIEKWIVLGHSYGGAVAQYYTIKYPEHIAGLILLASVPMLNKPELNNVDEYCFLTEQEKTRAQEIEKLLIAGKINYAQYFYNSDINGGWKRQNFLKPDQERMAQMALYDIVFDPNIRSDYDSYTFDHYFDNCPIPTLICEGKYDSLWSAEKSAMMKANHPNAQFIQFGNSSHNIYRDEPELFIKKISEWAKEIQPGLEDSISGWKASLVNNQFKN